MSLSMSFPEFKDEFIRSTRLVLLKLLECFNWLKATPERAEGVAQQVLQVQHLALQAGHAGSHDLIHQQQV